MRGFLLPSSLVLIIIMVFLIKPQSADSRESKSQTNITVAAACGSGHRCFVADDATDADSFMGPHYFDTMLATATPPLSYGTIIPDKPGVACPPKDRYTSCLRGQKNVPGQNCYPYYRACLS